MIFMLGTGLIALGSALIAFSSFSSRIEVIYLGIFLALLGIFEGAHSFQLRPAARLFLHLFMSILYCVAGFLIALDPIKDEAAVTLLHASFFITCGILRMIFSVEKETAHPFWLFLNGFITTGIGFLVAYEWPESALWVLSSLVGIDAIMTGWTWIISHNLSKET